MGGISEDRSAYLQRKGGYKLNPRMPFGRLAKTGHI